MLELIVLGKVPGTDFYIPFDMVVAFATIIMAGTLLLMIVMPRKRKTKNPSELQKISEIAI